jgi:chromatin structure-remodeling complex subunit RSC1/2
MSAIIKRLRKVQRGNGKPLAPPFERLPDKAEYPDYYKLIKDPICLTQAKANIRKKVYPTVDAFVADLARIFHNAQLYNEDGSPIHQAANTLLSALEGIAAQEQRKPEPLVVKEVVPQPTTPAQEERAQVVPSKLNRRQVEKVTFKDQSYRPGDWVLLKNVNDPATPTVAQVYRCFENVDDGSFGVHVCWYFRPQQTIHRADRFFWENEVFKTNQYRDQPVSDLLGLCHVMFLTRYMKCRPRFTESQKRELFVCEFRYNFEEKRFSKIKAWKSCQPDGAREEEDQFDLDMFQSNVHPPQVLSPLLNLLPKEKNLQAFDPSARLPNNLEHADKNAPPKTGNLIICPPAVLLPSLSTDRHALTEAALRAATFVPKQRPAPPPRPPSVKTLSTPARNSPAAAEGIQQQYTYTSPYAQGAPLQAPPHSYTSPYASAGTAVVTPQAAQQIPAQQNIQRLASLGNRVHPTALTLNSPQGPQLTLEVGVKRRFLRDEQDEIIWFTVPPIDPVARTVPGQGVLGHSLAYELWRLKQDNAQQEQMS